jgi:putative transposase
MRRRLDLAAGLGDPAAGALPRRADHRARPREQAPDVERDPRAGRGRRDPAADHPVPRRDGRARRTEELKIPPGPKLVEIIDARIGEFAARYQPMYPAAVKRLLADRDGLTAYLRFPAEHHNRIRHFNFIERTFGETRRRVKVIGRLPGETSCLTLVWAVLDRASRGWRGFTMTAAGLRQLQDLRRSLLEPPAQLRLRTATAAQPGARPETAAATA